MSDNLDTFVAAVKAVTDIGMITSIHPLSHTVAKFETYSIGICYASACTNLSDSEAEMMMNRNHPSGVRTPWKISKDETFSGGQPHPSPCPDDSSCRHILFNC